MDCVKPLDPIPAAPGNGDSAGSYFTLDEAYASCLHDGLAECSRCSFGEPNPPVGATCEACQQIICLDSTRCPQLPCGCDTTLAPSSVTPLVPRWIAAHPLPLLTPLPLLSVAPQCSALRRSAQLLRQTAQPAAARLAKPPLPPAQVPLQPSRRPALRGPSTRRGRGTNATIVIVRAHICGWRTVSLQTTRVASINSMRATLSGTGCAAETPGQFRRLFPCRIQYQWEKKRGSTAQKTCEEFLRRAHCPLGIDVAGTAAHGASNDTIASNGGAAVGCSTRGAWCTGAPGAGVFRQL